MHDWTTSTITLRTNGKQVVLSTHSKKVEDTKKPKLLCQKQTPKQIEKMLAAIGIIPTTEIDLNIIMADLEKAQAQRELFPHNFQDIVVAGTRLINRKGCNSGEFNPKPSIDKAGSEGNLQKKTMVASGRSNNTCNEAVTYFSEEDENDNNQGLLEKSQVTKVEEPVWMVSDDQEVEE